MHPQITLNAVRLRELYSRLNEEFRKSPHSPEHHAACEAFHEAYDSLAFPGGLRLGLDKLRDSDPEAVASAIAYLEAEPRFFRSGYIKETILRRMKQCSFSDAQQALLAKLIVHSIDQGGRREHVGYSRLAGVIHPTALVSDVQTRLMSPDAEVARRARDVWHALESRHEV